MNLERFEIENIEIPALEENVIWVLKFWSSLIPHEGVTDSNGHFLVSYGAWGSPDLVQL